MVHVGVAGLVPVVMTLCFVALCPCLADVLSPVLRLRGVDVAFLCLSHVCVMKLRPVVFIQYITVPMI